VIANSGINDIFAFEREEHAEAYATTWGDAFVAEMRSPRLTSPAT
jgi:hypothetical protein